MFAITVAFVFKYGRLGVERARESKGERRETEKGGYLERLEKKIQADKKSERKKKRKEGGRWGLEMDWGVEVEKGEGGVGRTDEGLLRNKKNSKSKIVSVRWKKRSTGSERGVLFQPLTLPFIHSLYLCQLTPPE